MDATIFIDKFRGISEHYFAILFYTNAGGFGVRGISQRGISKSNDKRSED
jgi:hypothetical protein